MKKSFSYKKIFFITFWENVSHITVAVPNIVNGSNICIKLKIKDLGKTKKNSNFVHDVKRPYQGGN